MSGSLVSTQSVKTFLKFLCVTCNRWLDFILNILHFVDIYITVIDLNKADFSKVYKIWYRYANTHILKQPKFLWCTGSQNISEQVPDVVCKSISIGII
jgi:hypothetical protein